MIPLILTFLACSNEPERSTDAETTDAETTDAETTDAETTDAETTDAENDEPIDGPVGVDVFELLQGDFDSTQQASTDPTFLEISLRMCAFEFPELGPKVLYVEQAEMSDLSNPYRQRVYHLENDDAQRRVASHVYGLEPETENALIGACDDPSSIALTLDQVFERVGCTVWFTAHSNGYAGGTEGNDCASSLAGATYATSDVSVTFERIRAWDQGWDAAGNQVWGPTEGAYIFERLTPLNLK